MPKAKAVNHQKPWTEEELDFLRREYPRRTGAELAAMLGRSKDTVYVHTSKLGLSKRRAINGNFFDEWSPEMAWVMGFWVADGGATDDDYQYMVGFWQKERDVLNKIKTLLGSGHALSKHRNRQVYALKTFSRALYEGLKTHLPFDLEAKSLNTAWPIDMPDEYARHFCRGLVDGDGHLGMNGAIPQLALTSGSKHFLDQFTHHVQRLTGIEGHVYPMSSGSYSYIVNSTKARCLAHWLYENCGDLCLERKKEAYNDFLDWTPRQIYWSFITPRMWQLFPHLLVTERQIA